MCFKHALEIILGAKMKLAHGYALLMARAPAMILLLVLLASAALMAPLVNEEHGMDMTFDKFVPDGLLPKPDPNATKMRRLDEQRAWMHAGAEALMHAHEHG